MGAPSPIDASAFVNMDGSATAELGVGFPHFFELGAYANLQRVEFAEELNPLQNSPYFSGSGIKSWSWTRGQTYTNPQHAYDALSAQKNPAEDLPDYWGLTLQS